MRRLKSLCLCLAAAVMLSGCGILPTKRPVHAEEMAAPVVSLPRPTPLALDATAPMAATSLAIPAVFNITRPTQTLTTTYATYFITGTSDPSLPVYLQGDPNSGGQDVEIQRLGTKGTFGVLVTLEYGENQFRFRQGDESSGVMIIRKAESGPGPITEIVGRSMIPRVFSGVKAGHSLSVGCTAPSGAVVTASFGGRIVDLTPEQNNVSAGLPVSYVGEIFVESDYGPDITANAGKVRYEMLYQGETKAYDSLGDVYVAGGNSELAVEVSGYIGLVYPGHDRPGEITEAVRYGSRDILLRQDNDYCELSFGGYVPKEQLRVVEGGDISVVNQLSRAEFTMGDRSEAVRFTGTGKPFYDSRIADSTFYLTIYNTKGSPGVNVSGSRLLGNPTVRQGETSVTYAFPLTGAVWGYNLTFDGDDLFLSLTYKPASLAGMTIILDPGHGGSDPGALGVAGTTGPTEADVNLAHAFAARDYLAALGANVILTRADDSYLSLDDRLRFIERHDADLFLSLQHNSIGENADANTIAGMEVYYHTPLSVSPANGVMAGLANGLNRNNRAVKPGVYRVTLMPYSPALLLELGFLSNPLEYEKATNAAEMNKVAAAIADGIKRILA